MKTHYIGHDTVYKKLKKEGKKGWSTEADIKEMIGYLERFLQADYAPKKGILLELGCGAGDLSLWLAEKGYEVYGVDISPTAIEWAKEKALDQKIKANFQVGNVLDLKDFPDNFFDFALDSHCFHCIIGADRKSFLKSIHRVLKPNGFFYVDTMCGDVCGEEEKKHFDPVSRCLVYNNIAARYIGLPDQILAEIREADFKVMNWEEIKFETVGNNEDHFISGGLLVAALKN